MKFLTFLFAVTVPFAAAKAEVISLERGTGIYQFTGTTTSSFLVTNQAPSPFQGHAMETYMVFDLSGLSYSSGSEVTSATLRLYTDAATPASFMTLFTPKTYDDVVGTSSTFAVAAATSDYLDGGSTWATRPGSSDTLLSLAEFDFVADGSGGYANSWITVDVTAIVQYWVDNPDENFGFHFYIVGEEFNSAGFANGSNPEFAPQLVVVPEPSSLLLVALGLGGVGLCKRRLSARRKETLVEG